MKNPEVRYFVQCVYTNPETGESYPIGASGRGSCAMDKDDYRSVNPTVRQHAYDVAFRTREQAEAKVAQYHQKVAEWSGNIIEILPPELPSGGWYLEKYKWTPTFEPTAPTECYIGSNGLQFGLNQPKFRTSGFRTRNAASEYADVHLVDHLHTRKDYSYYPVFIPDGTTNPFVLEG